MNQENKGWRNWSDHPLVVSIMILAALITVIPFFTEKNDFSKLKNQPSEVERQENERGATLPKPHNEKGVEEIVSNSNMTTPQSRLDGEKTNPHDNMKIKARTLHVPEALKLIFPQNRGLYMTDDLQYATRLKVSEKFKPGEIWFADPSSEDYVECKVIISKTFIENDENKHVIFLRSQLPPDSELSCHACGAAIGGALFYYDGDWRVAFGTLNFMELGGWGGYSGKTEVVKIGKEKYGFVFYTGFFNMGEGSESYVLVTHLNNSFQLIFSKMISRHWNNYEGNGEESAEISYIEGKNPDYYDLKYALVNEEKKRITSVYSFKNDQYVLPSSSGLDKRW